MPLRNGRRLLIGLACFISACRRDLPPKIDICIGDGFGGADCVLKTGEKAYRSPSELKNYWATTQADMAAFSSWCYQASPQVIEAQMKAIEEAARAP